MSNSRVGIVLGVVTCAAALVVVPEVRCAVGLDALQRCASEAPTVVAGLLREGDLRGLTRAELRLMRNEIYARHGYVFNSVDLQQHFHRQPWYRPDPAFTEARLSAVERANVELIRRLESR